MSSLHQAPAGAAAEAAYAATLFGRYLLTDRLSRGGMGELFVARHGLSGFEKRVVIKKILPHLAADQEFLTRFIDEAQVAVQLQHANIAQVFEVGRVDDEYFLAIEHIEGRDLRATVAALAARGRRMPPAIALYIAREVASGLAYAHRRTDGKGGSLELVHCDISPPNVMMSFEGETKIIDFGIARSALRSSQTDPNRGFGKFGYMSPEQLMRGAKVDQRTDLYAVGVLLFEMLTGRRLFEAGANPDYHVLARAVVKGQHPLPGAIDPALARFDELVEKALAPATADRIQTAAELRDAIQAQLAGIDPTFNADHLAAFMAELFGTPQKSQAGLDAGALAHWKRELTQQGATTVSLARAELRARPASVPAPVRVADGTPSGRLPSVTYDLERIAPRTRRWPWIAAGVLAMSLGAGLAAWLGGGRATTDPGAAAIAAAPAAPASSPTGAIVHAEQDAAPVVTALVEPAAPPSPADAADPSPRERGHDRHAGRGRDRPHDSSPDVAAVAAGPDPKLVEANFRAAHREYQEFKARFGSRLENEWNDLAHFATFGRSPDKLADFDRQVRSFRAQMSAAAQ